MEGFPQGDKDVVVVFFAGLLRPLGNLILDMIGELITIRRRVRRSFHQSN
jgi:hypothetical protein